MMSRLRSRNPVPVLLAALFAGVVAWHSPPAAAADEATRGTSRHSPAGDVAPEADRRRELLRTRSIEPERMRAGEIVRFDMDRVSRRQWRDMTPRDRAHLDVQLSSRESVTLELQRFDVISTRTRLFIHRDGGDERAAVPDVVLLRGSVLGEHGSHAYLALTDRGGGSGSITIAGQRYEIRTERSPDGDPDRDGLLLQRTFGGLPPVEELCRVLQDGKDCCSLHGGIAGDPPGGDPLYRGPRVLTIAVDSDHAYFKLFGNEEDALGYMVQLIGAVSDIFLRDLNFHLVLGFVRVWPEGGEPFSAASLGGFRNWWLENMDMKGLNLVHLFSGRRDLSYGGVAYISHACTGLAFAISAYLHGNIPSPDELSGPHIGIWDVNVVAHEIGHNLGTWHTHNYDPPIDTCAAGPGNEKRGTIMSYCHILQGGLLNIDVRFHATVQQWIEDVHAQKSVDCLWHDCNFNGVPDDIDILKGTSADIDGNGIPDECEMCLGPEVLNSVAIAAGAPDVNENGIPDACETDCTGTGIPDAWEIAIGLSEDVNGNNIPDQCEPDCLGNGNSNFLDILLGHEDIDRNAVPDDCQDCTGNGQPDWIDVERQYHLYAGVLNPAADEGGTAVREYHRDSGVLVQAIGDAVLPDLGPVATRDIAFGPDRQLYIANGPGHNVLRINVDTGETSVFVPSGAGGLVQPASLAFGPTGTDGNLYVASGNHRVLRFDAVTGAFIDEFIPAGSGGLQNPRALAFAPNGNLFAASLNEVLEYDGSTGDFLGVFTDHEVLAPTTILFLGPEHGSRVLIVNGGADNITHYDPDGTFLGVFNDSFALARPWGAAIGPDGMVYVTRGITTNVRIVVYRPQDGRYMWTLVRGDPLLLHPTAIAFRPASDKDLNQTGLPDECDFIPPKSCPADLNGSDDVGVADLLVLLASWGPCPPPPALCIADLTKDGTVGVADLLTLLAAWGECPK